ncbi:hypothetical protein TNCV_510511 [Trichonephila clavipes]|nr:hypothetical protein TNCV_510511 [Trichonephila clavipes]
MSKDKHWTILNKNSSSVPGGPRTAAVAHFRFLTWHDCLTSHLYRIGIADSDDKLVALTSLVKMWTLQQKAQCVFWLTEFNSVMCAQRHVRTEWNVDPLTLKSIYQRERILKEKGALVSQIGKYP